MGNPDPKGLVLSTATGNCVDLVAPLLKQAQEHIGVISNLGVESLSQEVFHTGDLEWTGSKQV